MNAILKITDCEPFFHVPGCSNESVALSKGEIHRWNGNHVGMVIHVREGTVWVTQCGDGQDVILSRGETFRVSRRGRVVAEGL